MKEQEKKNKWETKDLVNRVMNMKNDVNYMLQASDLQRTTLKICV